MQTRFAHDVWPGGLGLTCSLERNWSADHNWTDYPTWRHAGIVLTQHMRFGFHKPQYHKRWYLRLGLLTIWCDTPLT